MWIETYLLLIFSRSRYYFSTKEMLFSVRDIVLFYPEYCDLFSFWSGDQYPSFSSWMTLSLVWKIIVNIILVKQVIFFISASLQDIARGIRPFLRRSFILWYLFVWLFPQFIFGSSLLNALAILLVFCKLLMCEELFPPQSLSHHYEEDYY